MFTHSCAVHGCRDVVTLNWVHLFKTSCTFPFSVSATVTHKRWGLFPACSCLHHTIILTFQALQDWLILWAQLNAANMVSVYQQTAFSELPCSCFQVFNQNLSTWGQWQLMSCLIDPLFFCRRKGFYVLQRESNIRCLQ